MTAPDQPEPICGPSCDPMVCYVGHCALEQASDPDVRNDPPGPDQPAEHAASPAATGSNRQDLAHQQIGDQ